MAGKFHLVDPGTSQHASVGAGGAVMTMVQPVPPYGNVGDAQPMRPFRQYLTDDGLSTGSNDMQVSASAAAPQDFWVPAANEDDIYITSLSFVIADQSAVNNKFGNITALSNGCQLIYSDESGELLIHEALTTNFEFVRLCSGNPAFGSTTNTFRASNVSGGSEAYIPVLDIRSTFGFQWGMRLRSGTKQKVIMRIRDDTTGVDQFDCIAYGFTRKPPKDS